MTDAAINGGFIFVAPISADEGRSMSVVFDGSAASPHWIHFRPISSQHPSLSFLLHPSPSSAWSATVSQNLRPQTSPSLFTTTRPTASSPEAYMDKRMADLRAQLVDRRARAISPSMPLSTPCSYPSEGRVPLGKHFVASRAASPEPKRTRPADNAPKMYACPSPTKTKSLKALRYESYRVAKSHRGRAYRRYIQAEREAAMNSTTVPTTE